MDEVYEIGTRLQDQITEAILAEDAQPNSTERVARIAAFASCGYMVEKETGVLFLNPLSD